MSQGRILPLLGPAVVLYLIAEVVASGVALDAAALGVCALALALSIAPVALLRRRDDVPGLRSVALVAALAGVALVRWARPELLSLVLDIASALALPALGAGLVVLSASVPDRPGPLARPRRAASFLLVAAALGSSASAVLAAAPEFSLFGELVLVPPRFGASALLFFGVSLLAALALRLVRRRLGSTPEALAAGLWGQLGLLAALLSCGVAAGLVASGEHPAASTEVRLLVSAGLVGLVLAHIGMLGTRRRAHASRSTRRILAVVIALGGVAFGAAELSDRLPRDPSASALVAVLAIVAGALVHRVALTAMDRVLAPFGGRLVAAAREALAATLGAASLDEIGAAALPLLRRASGTMDAEPLLFTLDPPRRVSIDAAGVAHVHDRAPSPVLLEHVRARPGEVLVRAPLAEQVVRRADLRLLVEALSALDALAVVPLTRDLELEGLLVVPRGRRRSAITLEEIDALEKLGRHLTAQVALLSAAERARRRTGEAVRAREALEERLDAASEELAKLRTDVRVTEAAAESARFAAPLIAYGPAMRALTRRLEEVASLDAPIGLVGEDGTALDQVAHHVHASGPRRAGPFVVADCAAVRPERGDAALFGESADARPGWLRLAEGGTCLLLDVPALSLDAQAKLADAIATRRAQPADGAAAYPLDVRVVATSRVSFDRLLGVGAFDVDLFRRLEPLALDVPPLRERRDDVPSLVLVALDRSCRVAGRAVMGIEADALATLVAHEWPGNLGELASVIDRAVARARGPNVRLEDLPSLALPDAPEEDDPFAGTYAQIEVRILEQAIARANGNKSEAARLLGLKRTTFLDKLKRYDLLDAEPKEPAA